LLGKASGQILFGVETGRILGALLPKKEQIMKMLKGFVGICVLIISLTGSAIAGEILTPGIATPPPPAQSSMASVSNLPQSSTEPSVFDALVSGTVAIIQSFALLVP
jgi:hypothetical protein